MATQRVPVPQFPSQESPRNIPITLPETFQEALKAGYHLAGETSRKTGEGKRAGTVRLKNGTRPELTVTYEADRNGYRFGHPQVA